MKIRTTHPLSRFTALATIVLSACGTPTTNTGNNTPPPSGGNNTPGGTTALSGLVLISRDGDAEAFSIDEQRALRTLSGEDTPDMAALSRNGLRWLTANAVNGCEIWNAETNTAASCNPQVNASLTWVLAPALDIDSAYQIHNDEDDAEAGYRMAIWSTGGSGSTIGRYDLDTYGQPFIGFASGNRQRVFVRTGGGAATPWLLMYEATGGPTSEPTVVVDYGTSLVESNNCSKPNVSIDGTKIALCLADVDPSTQAWVNQRVVVRNPLNPVGGLEVQGAEVFALSPLGDKLAYVNPTSRQIELINITGDALFATSSERIAPGGTLVFSHLGDRVVADIEDEGIVSFDLTLKDATAVIKNAPAGANLRLWKGSFGANQDIYAPCVNGVCK